MTQAGADRQPDLPRELVLPCKDCQAGFVTVINGLFMRRERREAHVTLWQAAQTCKVSTQHLSRMERGDVTFQRSYSEILLRFYERRQRSGPE